MGQNIVTFVWRHKQVTYRQSHFPKSASMYSPHWNYTIGSPLSQHPMQPSSNRHQKFIYLRLLSYMLLDWAQILKGSGFLWMVPSAWESWDGRPSNGCEGGGGAVLSLRGGARDGCRGESVWALRWLETLCWELFWLSFLDNCCWRSRSIPFDFLRWGWKEYDSLIVRCWTERQKHYKGYCILSSREDRRKQEDMNTKGRKTNDCFSSRYKKVDLKRMPITGMLPPSSTQRIIKLFYFILAYKERAEKRPMVSRD